MNPILLKAHEAAQLCGVSERSFHVLRHEAGFPLPIQLGARAVRWRTLELVQWVNAHAPHDCLEEPAHLVEGKRKAVIARRAVLA